MSTIQRCLAQAPQKRIVVFGDLCLDKYIYSNPARDEASVETGLTARQFHAKKCFAGVGGTIAANLTALGAQVVTIGSIGDDGEGYDVERALQQLGADTRYLVRCAGRMTNTYMKPMIARADGSFEESGRLDIKNFTPLAQSHQEQLLANLQQVLPTADAVLLTDQYQEPDCGVLSNYVRGEVCRLAQQHSEKIFYADSRAIVRQFSGCIVKCNHLELLRSFGLPEEQGVDISLLTELAGKLRAATGRTVFTTLGEAGMLVVEEQCSHVPAFRVEGPIDICGAGDATNAGLVLGLCLGLTPVQAARLAAAVSSITIQQIGQTGTASPQQVLQRLAE